MRFKWVTLKFYSDIDFTRNLDSTVSDLVDYPGITELMDARSTYLINSIGFTGVPTISNIVNPLNTVAGDDITITAKVINANLNVLLAYRFAESELFTVVPMYDDGNQNDGAVGDSVYGANILNISNLVQYYIYAENDSSGRFSPERAAYEYYEIYSKIGFNNIVINEIMADNKTTFQDENGDYDDWIELFNATSYPLSTGDLYLSDESNNLLKWALPSYTIQSNEYFMLWADNDTSQSDIHTNFKLNKLGDSLWLSYSDGTIIDSMFYSEQYDLTTTGRYPNGGGSFIEMLPTYNTDNKREDVAFLEDDIFIYPNPAQDVFYIKMNQDYPVTFRFYSMDGRLIFPEYTSNGEGLITVDSSKLSIGMYLIEFQYNGQNVTKKVIITN